MWLNGWQRLWVVLLAIWTLPVLVMGYVAWPTEAHLSHRDVYLQMNPGAGQWLVDYSEAIAGEFGGKPIPVPIGADVTQLIQPRSVPNGPRVEVSRHDLQFFGGVSEDDMTRTAPGVLRRTPKPPQDQASSVRRRGARMVDRSSSFFLSARMGSGMGATRIRHVRNSTLTVRQRGRRSWSPAVGAVTCRPTCVPRRWYVAFEMGALLAPVFGKTAALFARKAREVETNRATLPVAERHMAHDAYVYGSIIAAATFLEATVNEALGELADLYPDRSGQSNARARANAITLTPEH